MRIHAILILAVANLAMASPVILDDTSVKHYGPQSEKRDPRSGADRDGKADYESVVSTAKRSVEIDHHPIQGKKRDRGALESA